MEDIVNLVTNGDKKDRPDHGDRLLSFLQKADSDLEESYVGQLCGELNNWLKQSNFKVCLNALNALELLAQRLGPDFKPHILDVMGALVERLGDGKEQVRNKTADLIALFMDPVASAPYVFEHIIPAFEHKNPRVREGALSCLERTLQSCGKAGLHISKLLPVLCKLVGDSAGDVREAAASALTEVYRHVGERLRSDMGRNNVPQNKMTMLMQRFDKARDAGEMRPTASMAHSSANLNTAGNAPRQRTSSVNMASTQQRGRTASTSNPRRGGARKSMVRPKGGSKSVGMTEEEFVEGVHEGQPLRVRNCHELETTMREIGRILDDDKKNSWEKRVTFLKKLRTLSASADLDNFVPELRNIGDAVNKSLMDLRSGVSKEACMTIAKLAEALGADFEQFLDAYTESLFKQVMINTKIMADSADQAFRYIIKCTYSRHFVHKLWELHDSKAVTQRRKAMEYVLLILESWSESLLHRHIGLFTKIVKNGVTEADSIVRATARRAYWRFHEHYPDEANNIMKNLDSQKQKLLNEEKANMESGLPIATVLTARTGTRSASRSKSRSRQGSIDQTDTSTTPSRLTRAHTDIPVHEKPPQRHHRRSASTEDLNKSELSGSRASSGSRTSLSQSGPIRLPKDNVDVGKPMRVSRTSTSSSAGREPARTSDGPRRVSTKSPTASNHLPRRVATNSRPMSRSSSQDQARDSPVAKSFGELLNEALEFSRSSDWSERMQAMSLLKDLLRSTLTPTSKELKKVTDYFSSLFAEPHNKVFSHGIDTLCDFIVIYRTDCPDYWLGDLLNGLLFKLGADMVSSTHAKILYALELVRDSFELTAQLSCLFKMILDQKVRQNIKVKLSILEYLGLLAPRARGADFEAVYNSSPTEGRAAIVKIIEMCQEPKSAELRKMATHVVTELFSLHPRLFGRILAALPFAASDCVRKILDSHIEQWEELAESGDPRATPERQDHEDDGFGDDSERDYNPSAYQSDHMEASLSDSGTDLNVASNVDVALQFLREADGSSADTESTLAWLLKACKESSTSIWEQQFDGVLEVVLDLLNDPEPQVREQALRLLREMLKSQTSRFNDIQSTTVAQRLVDRQKDSDHQVLRAADETAGVYANVMPQTISIDVLEPLLLSDGEDLLPAIRMLSKVVQTKKDANELKTLMPKFLPGLFKGYKHPAAEVRKAVVLCLVDVYLAVGEVLDEHLSALSSSQRKLLGIYIKRAQEKANKENTKPVA